MSRQSDPVDVHSSPEQGKTERSRREATCFQGRNRARIWLACEADYLRST